MKKILLTCIVLILAGGLSFGFGARDHKAIAIIAENHLTPKAAAAVKEITGGERLAIFASHPDKFRSYYLIDGKKIKHTFHVGTDLKPDEIVENSLFKAIEMGVTALSGDGYKTLAAKDSVQIYFAYIVHFVADMHCPGHVKYPNKELGTKAPKKYNLGDKEYDFHKCWDTYFLSQAYNFGTTDLAYFADIATDAEIAEYQKGSIYDWANETASICFDITHDGEIDEAGVVTCDPYFLHNHAMFNKRQVMKAGYRLAAVLNAMFQ